MSLYIFNSNNKKKLIYSLIFIIISIVSYSIFSQYFLRKIARLQPQSQWQDNMIKIETLITAHESYDNIILGSSLAARIDQSILNKKSYNFSFAGGSSLTALEILKNNEIFPKKIFIEVNVLRDVDHGLLRKIHQKKYVSPWIQESNQPVTFFISYLGKNKNKSTSIEFTESVYKEGLKNQLKDYTRVDCPILKGLNEKLGVLKNAISFFQTKNTEIVFMKIPTDPLIEESVCQQNYYQEIDKSFPQISQIKNNNADFYQTSDGIHLISSDAEKFINYINKNYNFKL